MLALCTTHPSSAIPHSTGCPINYVTSSTIFCHLSPILPSTKRKSKSSPLQLFPVFRHSMENHNSTPLQGEGSPASSISAYIANLYQATVSFFPPETFRSG